MYIRAHGFAGLDSFTYTVDDGFYLATAKVYIDVTNDPPDAQDDYYYTEQWQTLNVSALFGLLANDSDMDGDPLVVYKVNGSTANVGTQIQLSSGALLTVEEDGSFTYIPNSSFTGTDYFTYEIWDGITTSSATVYIDVTDM